MIRLYFEYSTILYEFNNNAININYLTDNNEIKTFLSTHDKLYLNMK